MIKELVHFGGFRSRFHTASVYGPQVTFLLFGMCFFMALVPAHIALVNLDTDPPMTDKDRTASHLSSLKALLSNKKYTVRLGLRVTLVGPRELLDPQLLLALQKEIIGLLGIVATGFTGNFNVCLGLVEEDMEVQTAPQVTGNKVTQELQRKESH
ncbi:uncharacterized protein LOC124478790 isoform X2 [Hypomesus transpacificus]|uniref:uncharacterized protein LOC124478790 isoform X2 n=1 Tax=Hypomesus transpacificus TaxID=137520 RepID=UPI001F079260|nr:uncharacterized protein LOC124478790 isoform X2 [Hypomesus transpacificus]